jgi:ABC-2 type transport system permease protein
MARLLVRLKLRLLGNGLHRGLQSGLGLLISGLFGALIGLSAMAGLAAGATSEAWGSVVTVLFGTVWVGWIVLPTLTLSSDDTLDPRRFALLPLTARQLVPGLFAAGAVGVWPIATLLGASGAVIGTWRVSGSPTATVIACLAVPLLVAVSVGSSRAVAAAASDALSTRRGRDIVPLVAGALGIAAVAAFQFLPGLMDRLAVIDLDQVAAGLQWSPGGLIGAAITDSVDGAHGTALLRLVGAAAILLVALRAWVWAIERTARVAPGRSSSDRARAQLYPRLLTWLPRGRTTAVAVRFLRMLTRDGRARNQALSQLFILVPMGAGLIGTFVLDLAPLYGALLVLPFGMMAAAQLGYDGPALWQHEVAGADPRRDLLGRNLALCLLAGVTVAVAILLLGTVSGAWPLVPIAFLYAAAGFAAIIGVANVAAIVVPYPLPEEASNVFSTSSSTGAGCLQGIIALATTIAQGIVVLPLLIAATLVTGPTSRWVAAGLGVLYGLAMFMVGTWIAVSRANDQGPDLLLRIDPRTA